MRHVTNAILKANLDESFKEVVAGFGDTLPLLRSISKEQAAQVSGETVKLSSALSQVYRRVFGDSSAESLDWHDAVTDVKALKRLLQHYTNYSLEPHCITLDCVLSEVKWCARKNSNLSSLRCLYSGKDAVISKGIAAKIAGSGLLYGHMKCVYDRSGEEGLRDLLSSKMSGSVRVTNRKVTLDKIIRHFVQ